MKWTIKQKAMLYKTDIELHSSYTVHLILFLSTNDDIERLQILQNKCMRNISLQKYSCAEAMNYDKLYS